MVVSSDGPADGLLERVPGDRGARAIAAAVAVLLGAFAVGVYVPRRITLPYLEPVLLVAALALLGWAALSRAPSSVRIAYRRLCWVGAGLFAGWWTFAIWRPDSIAAFLVVPFAWLVIATIESGRRPSLVWALGIACSPSIGGVVWFLRGRIGTVGSWWGFVRESVREPGLARWLFREAIAPVLLFGVPLGILAYLVGGALHRSDGQRPEVRAPSSRTVALVGVGLGSVLVGAHQLRLL